MTQAEYLDWWIALPDDEGDIPEPVRTLVEHIMALQERIDELPEHPPECAGMDHRCCCAYDHPTAVCAPHFSGGHGHPETSIQQHETNAEEQP